MIYGIICYALALGMALALSLIYIFRSSFMPYHRDVVQRDWIEIEPRMQRLLLTFIHTLGIAWLTCVVFSGGILFILLSEPVVFWKLAAFQIVYFASAMASVVVTTKLRMQTGAKIPVAGGMATALFSALGFSCIALF